MFSIHVLRSNTHLKVQIGNARKLWVCAPSSRTHIQIEMTHPCFLLGICWQAALWCSSTTAPVTGSNNSLAQHIRKKQLKRATQKRIFHHLLLRELCLSVWEACIWSALNFKRLQNLVETKYLDFMSIWSASHFKPLLQKNLVGTKCLMTNEWKDLWPLHAGSQ